ncbi:MAG: hypothetical protein ACE5F9_13875 [Phycisphaerae bacterium]
MSPQRSGVLIAAVCALGAGCGPHTLLRPPSGLPDRLSGRILWHTPHAYIYAADKTVAGETDRWIASLAGHVRRTYGKDLGKGLVIVIDKKESPVVPSIEELLRLERLAAPPVAKAESRQPDAAEQRKKLADSGMSEVLARRITPVVLDDAALAAAGVPPDQLPKDVAWRITAPSHRLMDSAVWQFAPKALEKKKGKAFAIATAWAWPLAFPEAAKVFRLARDVLVFQRWCRRQPGWSPERRRREVTRFRRERAFVISPTLALALSMAKSEENP